jgi:hypothetical protein
MTYQQAKVEAKKNPGRTYYYDAGNGNQGRAEYCSFRNRVICQVSRDGVVWF